MECTVRSAFGFPGAFLSLRLAASHESFIETGESTIIYLMVAELLEQSHHWASRQPTEGVLNAPSATYPL